MFFNKFWVTLSIDSIFFSGIFLWLCLNKQINYIYCIFSCSWCFLFSIAGSFSLFLLKILMLVFCLRLSENQSTKVGFLIYLFIYLFIYSFIFFICYSIYLYLFIYLFTYIYLHIDWFEVFEYVTSVLLISCWKSISFSNLICRNLSSRVFTICTIFTHLCMVTFN